MGGGLTDASYTDIKALIPHRSNSPGNSKIAFTFLQTSCSGDLIFLLHFCLQY